MNFDKSYRSDTESYHLLQPRLQRRMNARHVISDVNNGWNPVDMWLVMSLEVFTTLKT